MTTAAAAPAVPVKKPNRFVSFLKHVGHDLKVGLPPAIEIAETVGETAVSILAPGASALFNQTVGMIATAEQNYPSAGTGPQKSAAVVQIMGGLIQQGLKDAGEPADAAGIQRYINAAVLISKVATVAVEDVSPASPGPLVTVPIPAGDHNPEVVAMEQTHSAAAETGPSAFETLGAD